MPSRIDSPSRCQDHRPIGSAWTCWRRSKRVCRCCICAFAATGSLGLGAPAAATSPPIHRGPFERAHQHSNAGRCSRLVDILLRACIEAIRGIDASRVYRATSGTVCAKSSGQFGHAVGGDSGCSWVLGPKSLRTSFPGACRRHAEQLSLVNALGKNRRMGFDPLMAFAIGRAMWSRNLYG
jgi:hypothetical protein